jgi:osmoprotectant transport system permease protein
MWYGRATHRAADPVEWKARTTVELLAASWQYILTNQDRFLDAVGVHLRMSGIALVAAIVIFFPIGVLASRSGKFGGALIGVVSAARVVPSLAVLFLLLPFLGLGERPALVALTLLAGPALVINTDAGLRNVDPAALESARGLGMNAFQVFSRVQLPLAIPVIIAGVRTASVEVIGSATLAAFIGAGGLGTFITSGLTLLDERLLLVGAIPVTLITIFAESSLGGLERRLTPPRAA